jgi:hypothetical protein
MLLELLKRLARHKKGGIFGDKKIKNLKFFATNQRLAGISIKLNAYDTTLPERRF